MITTACLQKTLEMSMDILLFYNMCLNGGLNMSQGKIINNFIGYFKLIKYKIQIFLMCIVLQFN